MISINKLKIIALFVLGAILSVSCSDKDNNNGPSSTTSKTVKIDATDYTKWIYFSFEKDAIVEIDDFQTSMDWDIAFHRYDVRVNCGTAGPGSGGSYDAGVVGFETVTEAPETGYVVNDSITVMMTSNYMESTTVPGDTLIAHWLTFQGPPPTYTINDNIYILKTAKGKYAKIWLESYHDDENNSGTVTMRYVFQENGTRIF